MNTNDINNQEPINDWFFNNAVLKEEEIPENAIGFIYRIKHIDGRYYLGRKLLTKAATKTIKGKKKKVRKASDWQNYWSSSPALLAEIEKDGKDKFTREILLFVSTKACLIFGEEYMLFMTGSIFDPNCFNGNIRSRIQRNWFLKTPNFFKELQSIKL